MNSLDLYEEMYKRMQASQGWAEEYMLHTAKNLLTVFLLGSYKFRVPEKFGYRVAGLN